MKTITVCLGFNKNLEEAVATYVELFNNVFGNSKILGRSYFGEQEIKALWQVPGMSEDIMPGAAGDLKTIHFTLNGEEIVAFNGGAYFGKFHESMSLYVSCETQEQIDRLWDVLSVGGEEHPCGWVKDRFGVWWQIVPSFVWEIDQSQERDKAERMNIALFGMKKIDIAALRAAIGERSNEIFG
jgi:predicted 3-demethylubiquinone-9 3-methyltransferase (glyoxalase superfamily)